MHASLTDIRQSLIQFVRAEGPSLLGRNEPSLWYEAAAALGPCEGSAEEAPVGPDRMQQLQQQGEAALENEARLFDRDLSESLHMAHHLPACWTVSIAGCS